MLWHVITVKHLCMQFVINLYEWLRGLPTAETVTCSTLSHPLLRTSLCIRIITKHIKSSWGDHWQAAVNFRGRVLAQAIQKDGRENVVVCIGLLTVVLGWTIPGKGWQQVRSGWQWRCFRSSEDICGTAGCRENRIGKPAARRTAVSKFIYLIIGVSCLTHPG